MTTTITHSVEDGFHGSPSLFVRIHGIHGRFLWQERREEPQSANDSNITADRGVNALDQVVATGYTSPVAQPGATMCNGNLDDQDLQGLHMGSRFQNVVSPLANQG